MTKGLECMYFQCFTKTMCPSTRIAGVPSHIPTFPEVWVLMPSACQHCGEYSLHGAWL